MVLQRAITHERYSTLLYIFLHAVPSILCFRRINLQFYVILSHYLFLAGIVLPAHAGILQFVSIIMRGFAKQDERSSRITWHQDKQNLRLQQEFATLNLKTHAKLEEDRRLAEEILQSKQEIAELENLMALQAQECSSRVATARGRLEAAAQRSAEIERRRGERQLANRKRIREIHRMVENRLAQQRYISEVVFREVEEEFEGRMLAVKNQMEGRGRMGEVVEGLRKAVEAEKEQLNQRNLRVKQESEAELEATVSELERRVIEWRKNMSIAEATHEELVREITNEVQTIIKEIQSEVAEQRKTRQQNKEKILTLFENNVEQLQSRSKTVSKDKKEHAN